MTGLNVEIPPPPLVVMRADVDVAVLHVVVVVDGTGEEVGRGAVGQLVQLPAEKEGVGDHHLPRGSQTGTLVDGVVVLILLANVVVNVDQALHPTQAETVVTIER